MNDEQLIARLDALESRAAIETLIAAYANAFDRIDVALLQGLWHPDSTLDLPGFGSAMNREEILVMAENSWRQMPHMHHWMANSLIDIKGDSAGGTVAADCLFYDIDKGPVQVSGCTTTPTSAGGAWAFLSRYFELHFMTPLKDWGPVAGVEYFAPGER